MDTTTAASAAMAQTASAAATSVPPLTAHLASYPPTSAAPHVNIDQIHLARDQVPLRPEVWAQVDRAVAYEVSRARKATRILPQHRVAHHLTNVEQDVVLQNLSPGAPVFVPPTAALAANGTAPTLNVYEGATLTVIELSMKFALSHAQVRKENERVQGMNGAQDANPEYLPSSTFIMLARRVANTLCVGTDAFWLLGSNAFPVTGGAPGIPLFSSLTVLFNGVPADTGLTCIGGPNVPLEVLTVESVNPQAAGSPPIRALYSTNTVAKISQAVTDFSANGYGGPYIAVLPAAIYAKSFFPLGAATLQRPADIIIPLLDGYYDSIVLPGVSNPVTPNPGGILWGFLRPRLPLTD